MNQGLEILRAIQLITSPDEIDTEQWFQDGDFWMIGCGLYKDTYFYIGVPLIRLKGLYYA